MIIDVRLIWLPDLYKQTLDAYQRGVKNLPYTLLTGSGGIGKFINLYENMKRGYHPPPYIFGDVEEHGHILIRGGYHRLSVLRKLGYKTVSIQLRDYDKQFERFYQTMLSLQKPGEIKYHPLDHWSLSSWQVERGNNRLSIVKKHLPRGLFSFLDLGCYTGYFSNELACLGHRVVGVDHNERPLYCARYLANGHGARKSLVKKWSLELGHLSSQQQYKIPSFVKSDVQAYLEKEKEQFDYSLFFSVYRWMKDPKAVIRLLGERTRVGIFADAKKKYEKALVNSICSLTPFSVVRHIGTENGKTSNYQRKLFLFTR